MHNSLGSFSIGRQLPAVGGLPQPNCLAPPLGPLDSGPPEYFCFPVFVICDLSFGAAAVYKIDIFCVFGSCFVFLMGWKL